MDGLQLLGILSAFMALAAFVSNEYGKLTNESFLYDLLNFLAGMGLVIYALSISAIPFIITNSVWALVSGIDVLKYILKGKGRKRRHRRV